MGGAGRAVSRDVRRRVVAPRSASPMPTGTDLRSLIEAANIVKFSKDPADTVCSRRRPAPELGMSVMPTSLHEPAGASDGPHATIRMAHTPAVAAASEVSATQMADSGAVVAPTRDRVERNGSLRLETERDAVWRVANAAAAGVDLPGLCCLVAKEACSLAWSSVRRGISRRLGSPCDDWLLVGICARGQWRFGAHRSGGCCESGHHRRSCLG